MDVEDTDRLTCELKRFDLKERQNHSKDLLTKEQYEKIKDFKNNPNIIIRKADKSNTFVIMDKTDYNDKIDHLLSDESKFRKIDEDPTNDIKTELNKLITTVNTKSEQKITKIFGHFEPGYMYGNPKTHKSLNDLPLRPIVSHVGTVTYNTAKWINNIITPYMPKTHMIESTYEFVEIARATENPKCLASLDAESLFTNVPLDETIDIILDNVYNHPKLAPPADVSRSIMERLLRITTTQTPFRAPSGELYVQHDGVSMGTPLGPTFANFYMCNLENSVFNSNPVLKPPIYCRYVDDIFIVIDNFHQIQIIKDAFETCSILKFTYELEVKKQLPFLDTLVIRNSQRLQTTIHTKPTDTGDCMNYDSFCHDRYKTGVIKNFLHRAYRVCSTWQMFDTEVTRIHQLLVNNNFPNWLIDKTIKQFLNNKQKNSNNSDTDRRTSTQSQQTNGNTGQTNERTDQEVTAANGVGPIGNDNSENNSTNHGQDMSNVENSNGRREQTAEGSVSDESTVNNEARNREQTDRQRPVQLYFRSQMTCNYKTTERELRTIVNKHVKPKNNNSLHLLIYYKNRKLRNLFIRNNNTSSSEEFNVVYKYACDQAQCQAVQACYIGYTTTTIKERMKQHASIKKHHRIVHNRNITGSQITPNVSTLATMHDRRDLTVLEALLIRQNNPIINIQTGDFNRTLKIF